MYDFHDSKLWGLEFNFDASDFLDQNLILNLDYLIEQTWSEDDTLINKLCPCNLIFKNVSGFIVKFKTSYVGLNPINYQADSVYIQSIKKMAENEKHEHWKLLFIADQGEIEISCNNVELLIFKEYTVTVENEVYIPREMRNKFNY